MDLWRSTDSSCLPSAKDRVTDLVSAVALSEVKHPARLSVVERVREYTFSKRNGVESWCDLLPVKVVRGIWETVLSLEDRP